MNTERTTVVSSKALRRIVRHIAILCSVWLPCFALLAPIVSGQDVGEKSVQRWAIVASQPVRQSGLADLLTAHLSTASSPDHSAIELVERDDFDRVISELEISQLLGSRNSETQLKLSHVLGADVLVLLSHVEREEQTYLQLLVIDGHFGARLRQASFLLEPDKVDSVAEACSDLVDSVRRQYADGIQRIVAVSPFVSHNLLHRWDHLQAGYANVIGNVLMSAPGTAVLEMERADAVQRERLLQGGSDRRRTAVPVFVEGAFLMSSADPTVGEETSVRFLIRITDHTKRQRELRHEAKSLAAAQQWLTSTVAKKVFDGMKSTASDSSGSFSEKQQFASLVRRADSFATFGAWKEETGLREAALLIDPDANTQRQQLVETYLGMVDDVSIATQEARWRLMSHHLRYLVKNEQIDPLRAVELVESATHCFREAIRQDAMPTELRHEARSLFWDAHDWLEKSVKSRAERLPYMEYRKLVRGIRTILDIHYHPLYEQSDSDEVIEDIFQMASRFAGHEREQNWDIPYLFMGHALHHLFNHGFSEKQTRDLCHRLIQTGRPMCEFYGRCGLLTLKTSSTEPIVASDIEDANSLLRYINGVAKAEREAAGDGERVIPMASNGCKRFHRQILRMYEAQQGVALRVEKDWRRLKLPSNIIPYDLEPAFSATRLDIGTPKWQHWKPCGKALDLAWSPDAVFLIEKDAQVREVVRREDQEVEIDKVVWDGANIWLSREGVGIEVYSPDGQRLCAIDGKDGLPTTSGDGFLSDGLFLHPVRPGCCLAIGSLGEHQRVWAASVTLAAPDKQRSAAQVNLIYSATRLGDETAGSRIVGEERAGSYGEEPIDEIFRPSWAIEYTNPFDAEERWLLIGRKPKVRWMRGGRQPLAIDLDTLKVSLFPARLPYAFAFSDDAGHADKVTAINGSIIFSYRALHHHWPLQKDLKSWERHSSGYVHTSLQSRFLRDGDRVFRAGTRWVGFDSQTREMLVPTKTYLPSHHQFKYYGESAHYGMVGWNPTRENSMRWHRSYKIAREPGVAFQLNIDSGSDVTLKQLYPFVPGDRLQRHHDAVKALQSAGVLVGQPNGQSSRGTIVSLTRNCSEETIDDVMNLYDVRELYVKKAPITDQAMKKIGQLASLHTLYLVDTEVSSEGIRFLRGNRKLRDLRLDSSAANPPIGDAALKHLVDCRLERLTLYGSGFGDASARQLEAFKQLEWVAFRNASVSKAALDTLQQRTKARIEWTTDRSDKRGR